METTASESQCCSIKSKKNANLRCPNVASRGEFCAKHCNSRVVWSSTSKAGETNTNANANAKTKANAKAKPKPIPFTKRQKASAEIINKFWKVYGRLALRRRHGPTLFLPSLSHNDRDIYTFDTISTIPMAYHFSFIDEKLHAWTFDMRFLIQLLQYGKKLINPFSQEPISETTIHRLDAMSQNLRKHKLPIVYVHTDELTPEQIWNQKVLDVFLKLTSLGYGVNMLWFETMTISAHRTFYRKLYDLWNIHLGLSLQEKENIVPGHLAGRTPLFRWNPTILESQTHELRWWRKQNLGLMNAFLSRGQERSTQGCGALYILTALAQTHPKIAEVYPWLV
jgi:hypothetical protein